MSVFALNRVEKRRLTVFLSSLVVAIIAWLFFALSSNYKYDVYSKVTYINPPLHKAFVPLNDDTVRVKFSGTGWELLFAKFGGSTPNIIVDLKDLGASNYITFSGQREEMNQRLGLRYKILSVDPDTLFFDFSQRMTKKVPVKLLYEMSFHEAYGISGPIKITPDSVMVSGALEDLKVIHSWFTDTLRLTDIQSTINTKISFINLNKSNVTVFPREVKVEVPVDEFTEKTVEVPIQLTNSRGMEVRLFPEKVSVTILSALSNYSKAERDSFLATVDLGEWKKYRYKQLPVILNKYPSHSKFIKIEPQTVDFLVQKP